MTLTSYSFFEKYFGSEPATSARPPVLINGTASDVTNNTRFISVTPKSDTLFTNTLRFLSQCISKTLGFLDVRAFALFTLTLANPLRFLSQCIFESLRLSRCTGIRPIYAHTRKSAVLSFAVHLENPWFSRCTGIRPISRQKYAILCASTVSRISVGCTAHCLRSLYHVMGEQKIPKLSDSDTIFCCRFVETTLLIRFIFQADSVCNQCYKF